MALTKRGIGRPDYAQSIASAPVVQSLVPYKRAQTLSDMAELAARIGGPISIDRRGDVIWWDNFESGVTKWNSNVAFTPSGRYFQSGGMSGLMTVLAGATQDVSVILPQSNRSKTGMELSWTAINSGGSTINHSLRLNLEDSRSYGSGVYGQVRIVIAHETVGAFSGVPVVTIELATTTVNTYDRTIVHRMPVGMTGPPNFNRVKLVIDPTTKKYTRLIFAGTEYDISAYNLIELTSPPYARNLFSFMAVNNDTAEMNMYIDDVIITINEPDND